MTILRDIARAKINLTLEVRGRRSDSYHELESLVAFAELGDVVELAYRDELTLTIDGRFARGLSSVGNLVIEAANAAKGACPTLQLGRFRLTKNLPVAAGLGGGSADASAALRLLARANKGSLSPEALGALAAGLGADVTICLASRPALMTGRGEKVVELKGFPPCGVLLANPGVELATAKVYAALEAQPLGSMPSEAPPPDFAGRFDALIDYARTRGNHLEAPALSLAPIIGEVLAALGVLPGARLVRLSGSGATCFALFQSADEAERAAILLSARRPWWIAASTLG